MGRWPLWGLGVGAWLLISSCSQGEVPTAQRRPGAEDSAERAVVVDVAVAQPSGADESRTYSGTTAPARRVVLRSQAEGQLLSIEVDVGDPVQTGQSLAQVDADILQTVVGEADAELAARQFEVAQAEAQLADLRTQVESARVQLQQAQSDTQRLQSLAARGAISEQEAEQSQTTLQATQQAFQSTLEQVRTREQAVAAAQKRVVAQQAILNQAQERLSFTILTSPLNGIVLQRPAEPGDFVTSGQAVLELGDFSEAEVIIEVADLNRSEFSLGQSVQVQLDAFPGQTFIGQVTRISPVADPASRLIPIEITLPNPDSQIGSGLLARVSATVDPEGSVVVPQSALEIEGAPENTVFIVASDRDQITVQPRPVQVGTQTNGQVEIRSGLKAGETYVIRSSSSLQSGQLVERSLLSDS